MSCFLLFVFCTLLGLRADLAVKPADDSRIAVDIDEAGPYEEDEREENMKHKLFNDLMSMTPEEVIARFGEVRPVREAPSRQSKVDNFVVLFMENHAADQFFGCMNLPGFDGIPPGGHKVPYVPSAPHLGGVNISCGTADYVCKRGPTYDEFSGKFAAQHELAAFAYPYAPQDDKYSYIHGLETGSESTATRMYSPEQVPIKTALARNYGVFNKLYTSVPGPSSPNHLFAQSGTSCGMNTNQLYNDCGGPSAIFPQKTIYDSLRMHNVSFGLYMNSTCGLDGKPCHGEDPITDDSPSAINTPDVAMAGVARHHDRFFSQTLFYEEAANGTLPEFTWLLPPLEACDHPCHDISKGERLLKDVYEALRAGPKWNKTVLLLVYDDAGGYYDHVVPPYEGVPADDAPCHLHTFCGVDYPFDFRRLGLRSSAMLISPLVAKGSVFQEPQRGPFNTSQFDLTSIASTVKNLFNLSSFLTKRDAWAGSFDELLLDEPRADADMPMHLPEAPQPAGPWSPPPGKDYGPGHCSAKHGSMSDGKDGAKTEEDCAGPTHASLKQKRNLRILSDLTGAPMPDVESMSVAQAERWVGARWTEWVSQQRAAAARKTLV